MEEIGEIFRDTRESSGVSIKEASTDLDINEFYLINIEDGKIGCFKDIFLLKEYIISYAKYLGLDSEKLIDKFNEYLFEYTSKIPIKDIEKAAKKKQKEETNKIASPYTKKPRKYNRYYYIGVYLTIILLVILAIFWSIKQITIDSHTTSEIAYIGK